MHKLPIHMRLIHGAYYYRVPRKDRHLFDKGAVWLGRTKSEAFAKYSEIIAEPGDITTIGHLADRYEIEVLPGNKVSSAGKQGTQPTGD